MNAPRTAIVWAGILLATVSLTADAGSVRRLIITVNVSSDLPDAYTADGICDVTGNPTTNPPVPYSGVCTLRAAIQSANAVPGTHTIQLLNAASVLVMSPLPALINPTNVVAGGTSLAGIRWAGPGGSGDALSAIWSPPA